MNTALQDPALLTRAFQQNLTLVSYDQRTIRPLLRFLADQDLSHGGVVFVDERTVASSDFGGLVRALEALWNQQGQLD